MAKGAPELWVRLGRDLPYPSESIRSVTLLAKAGRLYLDVTAEVPVEVPDLDPARFAGVDLGIIHSFAVVAGDEGLLVSGWAIRSEERLHLEDTKRRCKKSARKAPSKGHKGSRRWRRYRASRRRAEARHRRRVRQAHHEAANEVVAWLAGHQVGTVVVGDPRGITTRDCGKHQNLRLRNWRRTHLLGCLSDKAEVAGINVVLVNERGTSSTCPECHKAVPKPRGRSFFLPHCGHRGHRDLVGARNIAARGGGSTRAPARVLPGTGPPGQIRESLAGEASRSRVTGCRDGSRR